MKFLTQLTSWYATALKQKIFERDYQKERCVYDSNKELWYANMGPYSSHSTNPNSTKFYGMGVNVLWESGEGWGRLNKTSIEKKLDIARSSRLKDTDTNITAEGGKYHVNSSAIESNKANFNISEGKLILNNVGTNYIVGDNLTLNVENVDGDTYDIIIVLKEEDIIKDERGFLKLFIDPSKFFPSASKRPK